MKYDLSTLQETAVANKVAHKGIMAKQVGAQSSTKGYNSAIYAKNFETAHKGGVTGNADYRKVVQGPRDTAIGVHKHIIIDYDGKRRLNPVKR